MTMQRIRSLLEARLTSWAAARNPALQIAWPNLPFTPPDGEYLRAFILPAPTDSEDLAGAHRVYRGMFQVSVVAAIDTGSGPAEAIAEEIAVLFPVNLLLSIASPPFAVQIVSPMSIARAINEPNRYVVPVSAQYRADTI